jgi:transcriptional regulator with XRE-family HTH domain
MNIGNAIKLVRIKRKLSQADLALRADISVSYLSLLERSKRDPALSIITKIAMALNMPIELLFFLGAEGKELGGMDKELAKQLALTALEFMSVVQIE